MLSEARKDTHQPNAASDPQPSGSPGPAGPGPGPGPVSEALDELRSARDELRLQIHLGTLQARDRFQHLEDRWSELQRKIPGVERLDPEVLRARVNEVTRKVIDDLKVSYRRLRDDIKKHVQ